MFDLALVDKYISQTTPKELPETGHFFGAYMKAMLASLPIRDALEKLHTYTLADADPETESLNFVLRSFCSSVGVTYLPSYREAILRSFVGKDLTFLQWFCDRFLLGALVVPFSGVADQEGVFTMDDVDPNTGKKITLDSGLTTDMAVRTQYMLDIVFDEDVEKGRAVEAIEKVLDLIYLVFPARLPVFFKFKSEQSEGV